MPAPVTMSGEALMRRVNALLGYQGADPDVLARQRRLAEMLREFRARRDKAVKGG